MVRPQRTAPGLPSPPRHKALQDSNRHSWSRRGHGHMRMEGPRWGKGRAPPPAQFPSQEAGPYQNATSHIFTLHRLQRPLLSTQPRPLSSVLWWAKLSPSLRKAPRLSSPREPPGRQYKRGGPLTFPFQR